MNSEVSKSINKMWIKFVFNNCETSAVQYRDFLNRPYFVVRDAIASKLQIGVGVIIWRYDNYDDSRTPKILLGKRKGSHGAGTWSLPGGHIDEGETAEQAAKREVLEETGIDIKNFQLKPTFWSEYHFEDEEKRYITLFFIVETFESIEPKLLEPEKCERWEWFNYDNLPSPLFGGFRKYYLN